jgi:hypothetical protein
VKSTLEELEARLRDAKFVLSREPATPEVLRILADRIDADGITVYQFYAFLELTGGAWTLTQPNRFWVRLLHLEDVFDLVAHLHAIHEREANRRASASA